MDYINGKVDPVEKEKIFIQVFSPVEVRLLGEFNANSFYERPAFLLAEFEPPQINIGQYQALEDFIINLQAHFFPNDTSAAILKVVGNIKDEKVNQFSDNGITQSVTAKSGIAMVESVPVPNPVTLKPYRTFPEIEQPESLFVFRLRQQQGQAPACGLWEADNKLWKVEAIKRIAALLKEKLPEIPIIA